VGNLGEVGGGLAVNGRREKGSDSLSAAGDREGVENRGAGEWMNLTTPRNKRIPPRSGECFPEGGHRFKTDSNLALSGGPRML